MTKTIDRALTALTAAAAIAALAIAVERRTPSATGGGARPVRERVSESEWHQLLGDQPKADVQVVVFTDAECPFCKRLHEELLRVRARYQHRVSVIYRHYPLPQHRFAIPAARLVECGRAMGKADEMFNALFSNQDSLGLKSWARIAAEASVSDTTEATTCAMSTVPSARIRQDTALVKKFALTGTPAVFINGVRFTPAPYDSLDAIVREALANARVVRAP